MRASVSVCLGGWGAQYVVESGIKITLSRKNKLIKLNIFFDTNCTSFCKISVSLINAAKSMLSLFKKK